MKSYNFEDNIDLQLYERKTQVKLESGKEDWRIATTKSKGRRYWRLEKGSRENRIVRYIGNDDRVRELCARQLNRRKPRNIFI